MVALPHLLPFEITQTDAEFLTRIVDSAFYSPHRNPQFYYSFFVVKSLNKHR